MSERGPLRGTHGGDPNCARNEWHDHTVVAAPRIPRPGSSSDVAGRLVAARRPSASATRPASSRACRSALATPGAAQVDRHRRLAVHRLRDGRMATQHPPQLRRADHADRRHLRRSRFEGRVLRSTARPRRPPRRCSCPCRAGDVVDARRCADPRQLRGLRRSDEGLRRTHRHRRCDAVQRAGARHQRVARRADRPAPGIVGTTPGGDHPGPMPSPTRPAVPRTGARAGRSRRRRRGTRRRRACAVVRAARTRRCNQTLAGDIRDRKVASIERARSRSGAGVVASANPGCSMHLAAALDCDVRHPVDIVAEALRS